MPEEAVQPDHEFLQGLRRVGVLTDLAEEDLMWFASRCTQMRFEAGEVVVEAGTVADRMFLIMEGELMARQLNQPARETIFVARAGTVTGVVPYSRLAVLNRTVTATTTLWAASYPKSGFPELIQRLPGLTAKLVATMIDRVRDMTIAEQQSEKMRALGRLSAGFAHELNNPVAAAERASEEMQQALQDLLEANIKLNELPMETDQRRYIACAEREFAQQPDAQPAETQPPLDPLARSDREDALAEWIGGHGVAAAWDLAPILVEMNWTSGDLADLAERFGPEALPFVLARLTATMRVGKLLNEIRRSSSRISGLVKTLKNYSFMDQAPEQEINLNAALNTTLEMLNHRVGTGIVVVREFDPALPCVPCDARALNQVWTNLIENALDAMQGTGTLQVQTSIKGDRAAVKIGDSGPGIPENIQGRLFEPFFTTKPPGQGTGLGLDTVYRIVRQHNGTVTFESKPGTTTFCVLIPVHRQFGI